MKPTVQIKLGLFSIHLIGFGKMRHLIWLFPALLAVASVSASSAGQAHKAARAIEIEDQFAFSQLSTPVLAPDGSSVFYVVEQADYESGHSRFQIMQQTLPNGPVAPITASEHDSWQPVVSEDGRALYFLSDRAGGEPQLWQKILGRPNIFCQSCGSPPARSDKKYSARPSSLTTGCHESCSEAVIGATGPFGRVCCMI